MVPRRIVLLGATGYLGSLVAATLAHLKVRPVLAARSAQDLAALGVTLGHGLDTAVVDVFDSGSILQAIRPNDVVVNMVGPFVRHGSGVIEATIHRRATYIDCAAEPGYIRAVFEEYGAQASQAGVALVPAFGYEYVAGNLAASLVLERTGKAATRIEVGYFESAPGRGSVSVGTRASRAAAAMAPQLAWRGGELLTTAVGDRVQTFDVDGREAIGRAVGGSEHIAIPRMYPSVRDVGVYMGGSRSLRAARSVGALTRTATRLAGVPAVVRWLGALPRSFPGPDEAARASNGSTVVAAAYDAEGRKLGGVRLTGANHYTFTAEILAWAALRAASDRVRGEGALGPAEAFGLPGIQEACGGLASAVYDTEAGPEATTEHQASSAAT